MPVSDDRVVEAGPPRAWTKQVARWGWVALSWADRVVHRNVEGVAGLGQLKYPVDSEANEAAVSFVEGVFDLSGGDARTIGLFGGEGLAVD